MLANTVDIVNVDGVHSYSLNAEPPSTPGFTPLRDFDVTLDDRAVADRYKQQQSGAWPTRSYEGAMTIHVEGSLFADTSTDYWTERMALLTACRGVPGANIVDTKRGTLFVTPYGWAERLYAEFQGFTFSAPLQGDHPAGSDILMSFVCNIPWFIGETSGTKEWWS